MCLFVLTAGLRAQTCEAPPELNSAIVRASDPTLPFEERMAGFRKLLERDPAEPSVNRYLLAHLSGYSLLPVRDRELPRIEALYRAKPDDPARRYVYALAMQRRDPKGSAAMLGALPDLPWAHLALAKIPAHLERFVEMCPDTLDAQALDAIAEYGSDALKKATIARLRKAAAIEAWPILWQLEFQVTPASGHEALRARIREDLAGIKDPAILRQGYSLVNDVGQRRWTQAELMRVNPKSKAAADATIEEWEASHPVPDLSGPPAERDAYFRKKAEAAREWVRLWPNYGPAVGPLYSALFRETLPKEELATFGRIVAGFLERDPDATLGFSDPPIAEVADRLVMSDVDRDLVPRLIELLRANTKARHDTDLALASRAAGLPGIEDEARLREWLARKMEAVLRWRNGDHDGARLDLALLRNIPGDGVTFWRASAALVEMGILMDVHATAREAIARRSAAVDAERATATTVPQKRALSMHESATWEMRAKLAVSEKRQLDAVAYYLRGTDATPRDFDPAGRARLAALARETWTAAGGTDEGWAVYRPEAAAAEAQWRPIGRPMPAFALQDTGGRPVRLADLAGKTVFINVWATWCGPCQGELPWVQRLYEATKDRRDVVVLTFNVDENPGILARYMQEHGLSFPVVLAQEFVNGTMKVESIPLNWIVDVAGVLRFERSAGFDESFVKDTLAAMATTNPSVPSVR